jgi:hypothetical protein
MSANNPIPAKPRRSSVCVPPAWIGIAVMLLVVSAVEGDEARPTRSRDSSRAPSTAAEFFSAFFFGGPGAEDVAATENRLDLILGQKIAALDFICGLTADQKQKMRLAGRRDIRQLFQQIERLPEELQLVSDQDVLRRWPDIDQATRPLRVELFVGPFRASSLFAKVVKSCLTTEQAERCALSLQAQREAVSIISGLGDKVQLGMSPGSTDEVADVRLSSQPIVDEDLGVLAKLPHLQHLFLSSTNVTSRGLVHLRKLPCLVLLDLAGTKIDSPGLEHLKEIKTLRVLDLSNTCVTETGLQHLAGMAHLSHLYLGGIPITEAGLENLKDLRALQVLRLGPNNLTDSALRHLAGLKNLRDLSLNESQVTDAGLAELERNLPNLTTLERVKAQCSPSGIGSPPASR